jgi:hypothetical protein
MGKGLARSRELCSGHEMMTLIRHKSEVGKMNLDEQPIDRTVLFPMVPIRRTLYTRSVPGPRDPAGSVQMSPIAAFITVGIHRGTEAPF